MIEVNSISKQFKEEGEVLSVLDSVSFIVNKGEFLCLIGPSGCGKSTLLRILAGLIKANEGKIKIEKSALTMVFQNFALFPWLSVRDNISFGLKMQGQSAKSIAKQVNKYIEAMGLAGFESKHPKELSGGMKQRVGIARALTMEPAVLLMDEPFSSLDAFTANKLRQDLLQIWQQKKMTIVMVTHLVEEAVELADEAIVMTASPGTVKAKIKVDLPRPRDKRSKEFYRYVDEIEKLII